MKRSFVLFAVLLLVVLTVLQDAQAAPIGIPGASLGPDESSVGLELNFIVDRDLAPTGDTEGMTVLAKGELGISKRLDLLFRFGFGRFEDGGGQDSDAGLVFGTGAKVTWASIPEMNIKIGSVAQMLQIRSDINDVRQSYTEYDFAIGAYLDPGARAKAGKQTHLATYGGLVFSSVDIEGNASIAKEDSSLGAFVGLLMNLNRGIQAGLELRLLDQTALSLSATYAF